MNFRTVFTIITAIATMFIAMHSQEGFATGDHTGKGGGMPTTPGGGACKFNKVNDYICPQSQSTPTPNPTTTPTNVTLPAGTSIVLPGGNILNFPTFTIPGGSVFFLPAGCSLQIPVGSIWNPGAMPTGNSSMVNVPSGTILQCGGSSYQLPSGTTVADEPN